MFIDREPVTIREVLPAFLIGVVAMVVMLGLALSYMLDLPIVYKDASTGRCVKVETMEKGEKRYSCSRLPSSYDTVWVSR